MYLALWMLYVFNLVCIYVSLSQGKVRQIRRYEYYGSHNLNIIYAYSIAYSLFQKYPLRKYHLMSNYQIGITIVHDTYIQTNL